MKKRNTTSSIGKQAENIAANYLLNQKTTIIERNFFCRYGEIDLIACDGKHLLFIEVRYRKNEQFLTAIESINNKKCQRLITSSEIYLNQNKEYQSYQQRFDVITITGELEHASIKWIKDAFHA